MKKLLFLIILLSNQFVYSQWMVYQYFDGANTTPSLSILPVIGTNTNNIWQIGPPQKTIFSAASTTPNVIVTDTISNYPPNNVSTFSFYVVPNCAWCYYSLQWKQKLDMKHDSDGGIVEFSTTSGNTWQNAHNNLNVWQFYGFQPANKDTINGTQYCFSGTDNTWRDIWLCLPNNMVSQNDTIYYRFTFKSNSLISNKEGWMIDNFFGHKTYLHPVKSNTKNKNMVVYPTVTNGIVNIEIDKELPEDLIDKIEILSQDGKLIESLGKNYAKVVFDMRKFTPGMYYFKITSNKQSDIYQILYEKN